ncbi:MAG: tRNA pseudouridine(13) synthase TruD [Phycisphaerales bacterium]|nr:tRNA pseudouridine(13) synthase TruD [Phycisphaerales bacterium]
MTIQVDNPLPQSYLTSEPGIGGQIKVRPEDFLVDELPLYDPCGEGEHLYLGIEKHGVSHGELMAVLCRHFRVGEGRIGFAGMKDKIAVTRQAVSIHLTHDPPDLEPSHDRIRVLWSARHRNKIRRGHLVGNRFSIRIRDVDPFAVAGVRKQLATLERLGVPNYFGFQRFGYRHNNHRLGALLIRGDAQGLLDELLGARGSAFPEYQRERRELYDAGRYEEAVAQWTAADRSELRALNAIVRGDPPDRAARAVSPTTLGFWINAFQSAVFNHVLDARLRAATYDRLLDGDLAWKHDSRSVFAVGPAELDDPTTAARLIALEISPSGPLWGRSMTETRAAVGRTEADALVASGLTYDELVASRRCPDGARRAMRVPLRNTEIEGGVDEHGAFVRVAFDLPRGAYATVVLRELMKGGAGDDEEGD